MYDKSLCTHIYTYSEIKVFVFPLAKSKILEGVVTAKGVRSGSQVQVQVGVWGRSFKVESTLAYNYWAGSSCLKGGQLLGCRPIVGFNIIGPKALELRGDAPLLSRPGALQHLKTTAQRLSTFLTGGKGILSANHIPQIVQRSMLFRSRQAAKINP